MQNSTSLGYALIIARGSTAQTGTSTAPSSCRAAAPKLNRLQRARPDTGSGEICKPLLFAAKQIPPGTLPWRTCANLADAQADSQATSSPPARHLRATNFPESLEPQTRRKQQPYHTRRPTPAGNMCSMRACTRLGRARLQEASEVKRRRARLVPGWGTAHGRYWRSRAPRARAKLYVEHLLRPTRSVPRLCAWDPGARTRRRARARAGPGAAPGRVDCGSVLQRATYVNSLITLSVGPLATPRAAQGVGWRAAQAAAPKVGGYKQKI